jgi:hypothetical protein
MDARRACDRLVLRQATLGLSSGRRQDIRLAVITNLPFDKLRGIRLAASPMACHERAQRVEWRRRGQRAALKVWL